MRVLLIDDDDGAREIYGGALRRAGYAVDVAGTVAEAAEFVARHRYDLYIIDQALPDAPGYDLCRRLRSTGIQAPILILSGYDSATAVVSGLQAGADDFLAKPCPLAVLLAHCNRVLSRLQPQEDLVSIGSLTIDLWRKRVSHGAHEIDLTAKEYALIEYLARRPGSVVPAGELVEHLWDESHPPNPGSLKVLVSVVRRKLSHFGHPTVIHTVRNRGYVLAPLTQGDGGDPDSLGPLNAVGADLYGL